MGSRTVGQCSRCLGCYPSTAAEGPLQELPTSWLVGGSWTGQWLLSLAALATLSHLVGAHGHHGDESDRQQAERCHQPLPPGCTREGSGRSGGSGPAWHVERAVSVGASPALQASPAEHGVPLPRQLQYGQVHVRLPQLPRAAHSGTLGGTARQAAWAGRQRVQAPACQEHTARRDRAAGGRGGGTVQPRVCCRQAACRLPSNLEPRCTQRWAARGQSRWERLAAAALLGGDGPRAQQAAARLTRTNAKTSRDESSSSEKRMSPCRGVGRREAQPHDAGKALYSSALPRVGRHAPCKC